MNPIDPTKPKDCQQLFNTGDHVCRALDFQGLWWRYGVIGEITCITNYFTGALYFYQIHWDDDLTVGEHYMGSSLRDAPIRIWEATS